VWKWKVFTWWFSCFSGLILTKAILLLIPVLTETTKRNKHTRQKHKKWKGEIYDTRDTRFPPGRELV
jgi:hypothetical protein